MVCLKLGSKFQTRRFDPKLDDVHGSIHKAQRHGGHVVNPHSYPAHLTKNHKGTTTTYANCFGMNPNYYGKDHRCVFPFIYRGIVSIHSFYLFLDVYFMVRENCITLEKKSFWTLSNYLAIT